MRNPYLDLTAEFNRGALRVLLSSGQAVVVHRLAIASKDGDWIVREQADAVAHVLAVLASHGATYRFGAPLDPRWLAFGWSSHFEFRQDDLRVRTDFVSRPPRVPPAALARMWSEAEQTGDEVVPVTPLAAIKLTNRERDYAVVGELARLIPDPADRLRFSRSARDLLAMAVQYPDLVQAITSERPALAAIAAGRDALETALDAERRQLMRANEARLARYEAAAGAWAAAWPSLQRSLAGLPLLEAHAAVTAAAERCLPCQVEAS